MLEINIFLPNGEIVNWKITGTQPSLYKLREFIKEQYPTSLGAEYIDS